MRIGSVWAFAAAAALAVAVAAAAQEDAENSGSGQSRAMKTAIMFYEKGDDMQAMDRFMDILVSGEPSERAASNEYLNLITHRMNSGAKDFQRPAPAAATQVETVAGEPARPASPHAAEPEALSGAGARQPAPPVVNASPDDARGAGAPAPAKDGGEVALAAPVHAFAPAAAVRPAVRSDAALPPADRDLMKKEIRAKLRYLLETSLKELKAYDGIRVLMLENGDPQAVGIPSALLFSSGITFNKEAERLLDSLTRLVFSLGSTQAVILPEDAASGDSKVQDMRRSMGISASLFSSGIAIPRVRINLLSSQVDIPKPLQDFKGIIIIFVYDRPLELVVDSSLGEETGPPISLGVYPQAFRPEENEGAVIEFSISDPPAGLVSWKFQLLQPASGDARSVPLQEVAGGGPVFHQIYWNGRQNYFGSILPAGRYECVLSATDAKNRTRTLHRWIQLAGAAAPAAAPAPVEQAAAAKPAPKPAAGSSAAPLKEDKARTQAVQVQAQPRTAQVRKPPKRARPGKPVGAKAKPRGRTKPAAKEAGAGPAATPDVALPAGQAPALPGLFVVAFKAGTHQMTPEGEKTMARLEAAVGGEPKKDIELHGFAGSAEPDAARLAERRARMIAGLLVNKDEVEPKRIHVRPEVSESGDAQKVEIRLLGKEQR
jgi:outer membrane protein OmpA-like peptidoglycan-associated protein